MWIARFAKTLLSTFILAMVASSLMATATFAVAKSVYVLNGGEGSSVSANGNPDVSVFDILSPN